MRIINYSRTGISASVFACLFLSTILSGLILTPSTTQAEGDSTVDEIKLIVPISCSMSGTGMNTHTAEISNGDYRSEIGSTILHAFCNDENGFSIYAAGYTGDKIGDVSSNKLVGTSASSNAAIETGLATSSGNPDVSNWAMKLIVTQDSGDTTGSNAFVIDSAPNTSGGQPASFSQYHTVPNGYVKVAHKESGTDMSAATGGVKLATTYAAYVSSLQVADTYTGKVIYTLVHPINEEPAEPRSCEPGKICYFPNSALTTGQMGNQSANDDDSITLFVSNFRREGYGFAGWNDQYDYSGNFYGPNQTITAPIGTTSEGLSLYAVWVESAGSLQQSAASVCANLIQDPNDGTASLSSVSALTDNRDGNTYAIAKLADSKCWIIENLRLSDKDGSGNNINMSSGDTHNPSLPITNVYSASEKSNHLSPSSSAAYNATTAPYGWCNTSSSACNNQSRLRTDNITGYTNNTVSSYDQAGDVYDFGNYYNWYSATAGHGKYGSDYASSFNAPGDICPAGWHLPTGKTTGEYYALNNAINNGATTAAANNKLRSFPSNFVYSGSTVSGAIGSRNSSGSYWSTSGNSSERAYLFYINSSGVQPGTNTYFKYHGRVVRCIIDA